MNPLSEYGKENTSGSASGYSLVFYLDILWILVIALTPVIGVLALLIGLVKIIF